VEHYFIRIRSWGVMPSWRRRFGSNLWCRELGVLSRELRELYPPLLLDLNSTLSFLPISTSIHLSELSPQAFRVFVVGTCYQLGSLAASASSTIESTLGERFPLPPTKSGITRYKYGTVICIFMACVSTLSSLRASCNWRELCIFWVDTNFYRSTSTL
jgi:hypothetical protein